MELALYHPEHGYYSGQRDPFGVGGDYYTNDQLQPVFGRLIALQLKSWRQQMGDPDNFKVLELGSGRAETSVEALYTMPDVEWITVDHKDPWPEQPVTGVVFCNEFFDALPVDLLEKTKEGWLEWRVTYKQDRFDWQTGSDIQQRSGLPHCAQGCRIESCERAVAALNRVSSCLDKGWILAIDYGYTHDEVERAGRFPEGSLMGYHNHQADPDVLLEPGQRDITAHVNFSTLISCAETAGLEVFPLESQQAFLMSIGEPDQFTYALAAETREQSDALRMQLKTLLFGLGETFRVLVMRKL